MSSRLPFLAVSLRLLAIAHSFVAVLCVLLDHPSYRTRSDKRSTRNDPESVNSTHVQRSICVSIRSCPSTRFGLAAALFDAVTGILIHAFLMPVRGMCGM